MARLMYGAGLRLMECCRLRDTTMIYTHVSQQGVASVRSPLDALAPPQSVGANPDRQNEIVPTRAIT